MADQRARCTNIGECSIADNRQIVDIPRGGPFVCPECRHPLRLVSGGTAVRFPLVPFVIVALVVAVLVPIVVYLGPFDNLMGSNNTHGHLAPKDNSDVPRPQVSSHFIFSFERSGQKWIEPALNDINESSQGRGGKIEERTLGSRESMQVLLDGSYHDIKNNTIVTRDNVALWNPADQYWVDKLNNDWVNVRQNKERPAPEYETLLRTCLVFVMWKDRANVFTRALQSPTYQNHAWTLIHDLATIGWNAPGVGGPAEWGKLKIAQSNPTLSNSGQVTLGLIYQDYCNEHKLVPTDNQEFLQWMKEIEGAVQGEFLDTTSKTIETLLREGKAHYDMAICYEQNALAAADKGETRLQLIYPKETASVNFPIAVLSGKWVNDNQKRDARNLAHYLLSAPMQRKAIRLGFRAGSPSLQATEEELLATQPHVQMGLETNPNVQAKTLSNREFDDLVFQWRQQFQKDQPAPTVPPG